MNETLDLATVRRFTEELDSRVSRCDNGEGGECRTLDATLSQYVLLCTEYRTAVNDWARTVFSGRVEGDPEIESLFLRAGAALLGHSKRALERGHQFEGPCYYLDGLTGLERWVRDLDYLLSNWVSPAISVGPAPRTFLSDRVAQEVRAGLAGLPSLPVDWSPSTLEQADVFNKQRRAPQVRTD